MRPESPGSVSAQPSESRLQISSPGAHLRPSRRRRGTYSQQDRRASLSVEAVKGLVIPGGGHGGDGIPRRPSTCEKMLNTTAHKQQISFLHAFETAAATVILTISRDETMVLWKRVLDSKGSVLRPVRKLRGHKWAPVSFTVGTTPSQVFTGGRQQVIEWDLTQDGDEVIYRRMRLPDDSHHANVDDSGGQLATITALAYFGNDAGQGWLAAGLDQGDVYIFLDGQEQTTPFLHVKQTIELTRAMVMPDSLLASLQGDFLFGCSNDVAFKIALPPAPEWTLLKPEWTLLKSKWTKSSTPEWEHASAEASSTASCSMTNMLPHATGQRITAMRGRTLELQDGGDNGQLLIAGCVTGRVFVWRPQSQEDEGLLFESTTQESTVNCVDVINVGKSGHACVGYIDGRIMTIDIATKTITSTIKLPLAIKEMFVLRSEDTGSPAVICGATPRNAFMYLPTLKDEDTPEDLLELTKSYRLLETEKSAESVGGYSWLDPDENSFPQDSNGAFPHRCLLFTGLRGSICSVVFTHTGITCGTSYGGVGSWLRHEEHHESLMRSSTSSVSLERRSLLDSKSRKVSFDSSTKNDRRRMTRERTVNQRTVSDTGLVRMSSSFKGEMSSVTKIREMSSVTKMQARWWSMEQERIMQHETPTLNSLFWKQLKDAVVFLNDNLQIMSFAWTLEGSESHFPDISPMKLAYSISLFFEIHLLPLFSIEDSFWLAFPLSALLVLAVLLHLSLAFFWNDAHVFPRSCGESCSKRLEESTRWFVKFLLMVVWFTTTIGQAPLMRQMIKPTNCCLPESSTVLCQQSRRMGQLVNASNSSQHFVPQCFDSNHVAKYLLGATMFPVMSILTARLRRLNGKGVFMSTSVWSWNSDIYELSAHDESPFSQHNGNYVQRVFVLLLAIIIAVDFVFSRVYPKEVSVCFFLVSVAQAILFWVALPYYESRMNAMRSSFSVLCMANNGVALYYIYNPEQRLDETPMIVFYCCILPVCVAVFYIHLWLSPLDVPDMQPLSHERDAKLYMAKIKSFSTSARRKSMNSLRLLALGSDTVTALYDYHSYIEGLVLADDPYVAHQALGTLIAMCRSRRDLNYKYFGNPELLMSYCHTILTKHFTSSGMSLLLTVLRWLETLLTDRREVFKDECYATRGDRVRDAASRTVSGNVKMKRQRTMSANFFENTADEHCNGFSAAAYPKEAQVFKDKMLETKLFETILRQANHSNDSPGVAQLMCRLLFSLSHDVTKADADSEEGWQWSPNLTRMSEMVRINSFVHGPDGTTLTEKSDAWQRVYLGEHRKPTHVDELIKEKATMFGIHAVFAKFDENHSGTIDSASILVLLAQWGVSNVGEELLASFDKGQDGLFSFEEFASVFTAVAPKTVSGTEI